MIKSRGGHSWPKVVKGAKTQGAFTIGDTVDLYPLQYTV